MSDEKKDAPAPAELAGIVDVPDEVKARIVQLAKEKVAGAMLPALKDPRTRMRTIVAMKVLGIVEREIGKAEGPLPEEWDKLREMVAKQPEAVEMVGQLQGAMRTFADDLERKIQAGEVDAETARQASLKVIRLVLLKNIQIGQPAAAAEKA